ncbi:Hypothetical protein I595_1271 [Croceitalea dokdonensis DOKDO 023]|uniref:Uncharacterized protein n=1 Tax=Croceitalea dokdonensis DOKDO 023 TaxID=1300341 RepID=A0A0N8H4A7_9FLAO|nr:Hypothetical protein I595_1271 [Croceitalea dokdonensis DOKDO 023]
MNFCAVYFLHLWAMGLGYAIKNPDLIIAGISFFLKALLLRTL